MEVIKLHHQQLCKAYKRLVYMNKKFIQLTKQTGSKHRPDDEEYEIIAYRDSYSDSNFAMI